MKQNGIKWPENAQTERPLAGRKMARRKDATMKKTDELLLRLDYISREVDRLKAENQSLKKLAKKAIRKNKEVARILNRLKEAK